jgi:hypothetical protein
MKAKFKDTEIGKLNIEKVMLLSLSGFRNQEEGL